jgi:hypothetical protein
MGREYLDLVFKLNELSDGFELQKSALRQSSPASQLPAVEMPMIRESGSADESVTTPITPETLPESQPPQVNPFPVESKLIPISSPNSKSYERRMKRFPNNLNPAIFNPA